MHSEEFHRAVLTWFDSHGRRHLPWQQQPTPYRVWVSEIMLQQTQVASVVPYFIRFMERFPDVEALARAEMDEVLQHWAGLGYYARARHLHRAARVVVQDHGGRLPANGEALCALPGIGRSTAGAIMSLGFGVSASILDGNVKRVLSRFFGITGWPGEARVLRELWAISERYTPAVRSGDYNQAMMDLGATLCTRDRPDCSACPLRQGCEALHGSLTASIPAPRPHRALPVRRRFVLALRTRTGEFWLQRRPPQGIWGGLLSLPEFEDQASIHEWCIRRGADVGTLEYLPERRHTFTHFHLDYRPVVGWSPANSGVSDSGSGAWLTPHPQLALPTPIRRLLDDLCNCE